MIRVVIDTNLWISTLISRRLVRLETLLKSDRITLLFSAELMGEFLDTVQHPKFRKYFAAEDVQSLLQNIEPYREEIAVVSQVTICRDPKENFLLALAQDGAADFLVTGDEDLLVLKQFGKTRIVRYAEFETLV